MHAYVERLTSVSGVYTGGTADDLGRVGATEVLGVGRGLDAHAPEQRHVR
jgi:hypothetical protein